MAVSGAPCAPAPAARRRRRRSPLASARAALALALALAPRGALAQCPNMCNGRGRCVGVNRCACFGAWAGGDCSQRRCPVGPAWADVPAPGADAAHAPAECSARGVCDARTGACACAPGFEGPACERMACGRGAAVCGAHGECQSMARHAATVDAGALPLPLPYSNARAPFKYTANWDAQGVHGCTCDAGYGGWRCDARVCPAGDDPLTGAQADEVQLLRCDADPTAAPFAAAGVPQPAFRLSFRGALTRAFTAAATAADIKALLEELPAVTAVSVAYLGGGVAFCDASHAGAPASATLVAVTFLYEHGALPRLVVLDEAGRPLTGAKDNAVSTAAHGESLSYWGLASAVTVASVAGTKEWLPCSGRGRCDERSGVCRCFTGFTASNGRGGAGAVPDCGFPYLPVTSCPGDALECSGHGTCAGAPTFACACHAGWAGGDCATRTCPFGPAWFDYPSAPETAHAPAECSNKGTCDRRTGACACAEGFVGAACERLACPLGVPADTPPGAAGRPAVCSGRGQCVSMRQAADFAAVNGEPAPATYGQDPSNGAAWDADSVYGCVCAEGYAGYDCSLRSCPRGNDITLLEEDGAADEVQELRCLYLAGAPTFRLSFRGAATAALPYTATVTDVAAALAALPTMAPATGAPAGAYADARAQVVVQFINDAGVVVAASAPTPTGAAATAPACAPAAAVADAQTRIVVFFQTVHGDVPPIAVALDAASQDATTLQYGSGAGWTDAQLAWFGGDAANGYAASPAPPAAPVPLLAYANPFPATGVRAREVYKGQSIDAECSGRGLCDGATGECRCFLGFGASDGNRRPGAVENCGWREEYAADQATARAREREAEGAGGAREDADAARRRAAAAADEAAAAAEEDERQARALARERLADEALERAGERRARRERRDERHARGGALRRALADGPARARGEA